MKKLLILTSIFCLFSLSLFCQKTQLNDCKSDAKTYKVRIKKSFSQNQDLVESLIPRELKESEFCLVEKNRNPNTVVVLSLDERHEIIIYPIQRK